MRQDRGVPCSLCGLPMKKNTRYGICSRPTCKQALTRAAQEAYRIEHPLLPRRCQSCRGTFQPEHGNQRFCCVDCRQKWQHGYIPSRQICFRCLKVFHPTKRVEVCRSCQGQVNTEKRDYINEFKLKTGCKDCGYRENRVALQYDHLPQFEKLFELSDAHVKPWCEIMAEIEKCDVVCANCHSIRTANRRIERGRQSKANRATQGN